jgi:hydrogenase-4 component E
MVNYLIVIFAVTLIYFASAERLSTYVRLIALQGLILCGIAVLELKEVNLVNLLFIVAETLFFKAMILPFLLNRILRRSGETRVHRLAMPGFYLLLFSIAGLFISVSLATILVNPYINTIYLTISLFTLYTGLLLIVTHQLIISHLIGFLVVENAVFFFSLAVGSEMPMFINIGLLLDLFVGALILGFFGLRLKPHTDELTMLKD